VKSVFKKGEHVVVGKKRLPGKYILIEKGLGKGGTSFGGKKGGN